MSDPSHIPPPPPWPEPAVTGLVEVTDEPIAFTPVPRLRKRCSGWTELAQRAFIAALEECGCSEQTMPNGSDPARTRAYAHALRAQL